MNQILQNSIQSLAGDAIASLKLDSHPSAASATPVVNEFFKVLDKLQKPEDQQQQESRPSSSSEESSGRSSFLDAVKHAGILAVVFAVLCLPCVQNAFTKIFANAGMRVGITTLIFFIVALVLMNRMR